MLSLQIDSIFDLYRFTNEKKYIIRCIYSLHV